MAKGILRVKVLGDVGDLDRSLTQAGGVLDKFGSMAKAAGIAIGAAFVGAAAAVGKFALTSAVDIDDAMDTIRVGTGATGQALEGLGDSFKTVFTGVPASAEDVGRAIADLNTRTGATGTQLETLATKATLLAKITGEDLGGQVEAVTRVFGDWGIAAKDQAGSMDYLFRVSQTTGIGVTELSEKVVQFGAPLRQMGFDFETSAALMGKFEKEGVNLETVMAGMRIGLAHFAKAGEAPAEALARATEAIKNAGSAAEANKLAIEIFGARAGPDMAAAIREGRFEIDDLLTTLAASPETINAAAEATYDFGEKWAMLKNKLAVVLEPLGRLMMDALGGLIDWVSQFMPQIMSFFGSLGEKVRESGLSFGDFGAALNMLNPIMGIFKDLWPQLQPLIQAIAGLLIELAANVLPIVSQAWSLFIEVVTPIVQAFLDVVMQVFPTILETIRSVMNAVLPIVEGVLQLIQGFWQEHGDTIMALVRTVFGVIQTVITTVMNIIQGIIKVVMGIISGDWSQVWEGVKQVASAVWEGIKGIVTGAMDIVKGVIEVALGVIQTVWSTIWNGIRTLGESIWGGIKSAASSVFETLKSTLSGIWNGISTAWQSLWTACSNAWNTASAWIQGIPGKIKGFFSGAGTWLYGIGKSILTGLLNGLKAAWESVVGFLKGLGSKIKSLKGPLEKDRQLLVPEGAAIIQGLHKGMEEQVPRIRKLLSGLSAELSVTTTSPGGSPGYAGASGAAGKVPVVGAQIGPITVNIYGQGAAAGEAAADAVLKRLAAAGVRL